MEYHEPGLHLYHDRIETARGTLTVDDLPDVQPKHHARLVNTTPLMERLWRVALRDIEAAIQTVDGQRYFGAGAEFGAMVYTRDISFSGILGLNRLYPDIMLDSLKHTQQVRFKLGWRVPASYHVPEFDAPWELEDLDFRQFMKKYKTNNFMRRTDDVIWLWAAQDLAKTLGDQFDWEWMYATGKRCFEDFYSPLYDPNDGLYRGQACFIDIHFESEKASGYPLEWSIPDCVRIKATSTNALYVLGMEAMADAARHLKHDAEAKAWSDRADALRDAMRANLMRGDGTFAYYRTPDGTLAARLEALSAPLVAFAKVLDDDAAVQYLRAYSITPDGIPLFQPFFDFENTNHNRTSWPFVDTLFLRALHELTGEDTAPRNAALMARCNSVEYGTFCEMCYLPEGIVKGSPQTLWTATSFVDVCERAGLEIVAI